MDLDTPVEVAARAAYDYFRARNGQGASMAWEHLHESAQSLWRGLATRTHEAWEVAAGR